MKKWILCISFVTLGAGNCMSQDNFEDFRKKIETEYSSFRNEKKEDFENFRNKINEEYAALLEKSWEEFNAIKAMAMPKEEETPPIVYNDDDDSPAPIRSNPVPILDIVAPPMPEPQPVPVVPIEEQPAADREIRFTYCGTSCQARFPSSGAFSVGNGNNEALARAWDTLSGKAYNNTLRDCLALRRNMQLSDWAYLNLISAFAEACCGKGNEATFLTAFIYCQSGYRMRIGREGNTLHLLFASRHAIYEMPYFSIGDEAFYVWNGRAERLDICGASFPDEQPLSLYIPRRQQFAFRKSSPRTRIAERYADMAFTVSVNENLMDFYNSYPPSEADGNFMTRWAMYANTPMEQEVAEQLYPAMRAKLQGLSESEAAERLLNWVQTAFAYEYDDKVWGQDRAFFAEESLHYPYCDCEDRSILFTRLVRDLLGLRCILVYYPGHLAAAVRFTHGVDGDYLTLDGERYTVCDPTYIGAPAGMTMPGMDNRSASVILLEQ